MVGLKRRPRKRGLEPVKQAAVKGHECMRGKRIQFDDETWMALDLLARDRMMDFQELADEAFRDLLKKHNRPSDLKSALRQSAGIRAEAQDRPATRKQRKRIRAGS